VRAFEGAHGMRLTLMRLPSEVSANFVTAHSSQRCFRCVGDADFDRRASTKSEVIAGGGFLGLFAGEEEVGATDGRPL